MPSISLPTLPLNALDVVRMSIAGNLPSDICFLSALVNLRAREIEVDASCPVIVHQDHPDLLRAILDKGGKAALHPEARDPAHIPMNGPGGRQYRLITGDTAPLIQTATRGKLSVAMLKRDYGAQAFCVPGGFASDPDVRLHELMEELALVIFNPAQNRAEIIDLEPYSFCSGRPIAQFNTAAKRGVIEKNLHSVWALNYPGAPMPTIKYRSLPLRRKDLSSAIDEAIQFTVRDGENVKVYHPQGSLIPHWEMNPGMASERNIVGMHGFARIALRLSDAEQLVVVDAEPFNRSGVLFPLKVERPWKLRAIVPSSKGIAETTGYIGFATKLADPAFRCALA